MLHTNTIVEISTACPKTRAKLTDVALASEQLDEGPTEACCLVGQALGTGRSQGPEIEPRDERPNLAAAFAWGAEAQVGQPSGSPFNPEDRATGHDSHALETGRRNGIASDVRCHTCKTGSRAIIRSSVLAPSDGAREEALCVHQVYRWLTGVHREDRERVRVTLSAAARTIVQTLFLVLHEPAADAHTYLAPSETGGRLRVEWHRPQSDGPSRIGARRSCP